MRLDDDTCWERLRTARHGVLSTVHPVRGVDAVPVVFVVQDGQVVLPIDTVKAKSGARLQRLRNLDADPRAVLLVDRYQPDWSDLWWIRAHGRAAHDEALTPEQHEALAATFRAYRSADAVTSVIVFEVDEITGWQADAPDRVPVAPTSVELRPYERDDLDGVIALCAAEGWPSLPADADRAHRVLTNPGVIATVARDQGQVVGFAYGTTDGALQGYLASMAVDIEHRRRGIGVALVADVLARSGAQWLDLLSVADDFYERLPHSKHAGFRVYPPQER